MLKRLDFTDLIVRNVEGWDLLERFWISTVASFLGIRAFLRVAGNPQLGFGSIHFAHVLFGGIIMLVSIIILLTLIDRRSRIIASVVGGVGFGAFIDELGKFITRDNNYWFKPTIAFIYLILVLLFILFRQFARNVKLRGKEYAVNALELAKEMVDKEERRRAMLMIKQADQDDPVVKLLKKTFIEMKEIKGERKSSYIRAKHALRKVYSKLVGKQWFNSFVVIFFVIRTMTNFIEVIINIRSTVGFYAWGLFLSVALSAFFVFVGAYFVQKNDISTALDMFKVSLLITIFLSHFFLFYFEQLSAIGGLFIDILIYGVLQYLIDQNALKIDRT